MGVALSEGWFSSPVQTNLCQQRLCWVGCVLYQEKVRPSHISVQFWIILHALEQKLVTPELWKASLKSMEVVLLHEGLLDLGQKEVRDVSEWLLPFWHEGQEEKHSWPWLFALSMALLVSVQKGGELAHGPILPALAGCPTAQPGANWSYLSCC